MSEKIDRRVFTNTYVTGLGRQNYLNIDYLEDPLFTSFTFDIDFTTSPLFYTINYSNYGYPNADDISKNIEASLKEMYKDISIDQGYDILPLLSAFILDGNKLGFGIQQNVYTDKPLYGATEYIYMVDKRNGGANQNDARFDSNRFAESGGDPNALNSYKLGDSVTELVNESDREWAENNKKANEEQIEECDKILLVDSDEDSDGSDVSEYSRIRAEHESNKNEMGRLFKEYKNIRQTVTINGEEKELTEEEIAKALDECTNLTDEFEGFKQNVTDYINQEIAIYQNRGDSIYNGNDCYKRIANETWSFMKTKMKDTEGHYRGKPYADLLKSSYGENLLAEHLVGIDDSYEKSYYKNIQKLYCDFFDNFVTQPVITSNSYAPTFSNINDNGKTKIISKFKKEFEYFGFPEEGETDINIGNIKIFHKPDKYEGEKSARKWVSVFGVNILGGVVLNSNLKDSSHYSSKVDGVLRQGDIFFKFLMGADCDMNTAFSYEDFSSKKIKDAQDNKGKYEAALSDIRFKLYGYNEETKTSGDKNNPSPDSIYGQYLEAQKKYENDEYSQAERTKSLAQSGATEAINMLSTYDKDKNYMDKQYNQSVQKGEQPSQVSRTESIVSSQTVLDMLGFISGMKNMTQKYPYIIQGVTGLDVAYNKHYVIKDPYLGSGEDKITLTCLESLDLRVSSMFNRYFNAVYDRQYRRERVPVNLRRFNCSIYVHDVRNFVAKSRFDKYGDYKMTYNRILELTDMYYSVIEFRFFDCEIVPEETGNIFNDISNEAPSDMKKTNFTFTYGNCVVNFVPQSEVSAH